MALISPGLQLSVTDESQYVPGAVGSVPLLVLATEQDKTANGSYSSGTSKANAGKLQVFTSQRELVSALGYPVFKQSASGTPLHGSPLNEYGLMAAYTTLASANRLYAIRADIDLKELEPTSVRPIGEPEDGTFWLDATESDWGIYVWNAELNRFEGQEPLIITSDDDTVNRSNRYEPLDTIGQPGDFAVLLNPSTRGVTYWQKGVGTQTGIWYWVGSEPWSYRISPTVVGNAPVTAVTSGDSIVINGETITWSGTSVTDVVNSINASFTAADGVRASSTVDGRLTIYASQFSASNGTAADGVVSIAAGSGTGLFDLGLEAGDYHCPEVFLGSYVDVPNWNSGNEKRPTGSVYIKTSAIGNGINMSLKRYSTDAGSWVTLANPVFGSEAEAIYNFDPVAGGFSIGVSTCYTRHTLQLGGVTRGVQLRTYYRRYTGASRATRTPTTSSNYPGGTVEFVTSEPGTDVPVTTVLTFASDNSREDFINAFIVSVSNANIPDVYARREANGDLSIVHASGGIIKMRDVTGTTLASLGFSISSVKNEGDFPGSYLEVGNFFELEILPDEYQRSFNIPYKAPADGKLWYFGDATQVDIMINTGAEWKGYRNVTTDARGFDLSQTDSNGPIVTPTKPKTNSTGASLKAGDIWLDTSDLENYPKLYRYNSQKQWIAIDNTDRVSQNGIIFADARWDTDGTSDVIADDLPSTADLLTSDYVDLDCPNPRLYPRGTLLFNTRRSGFNVKKFVGDYFNEDSFPEADVLPVISSAWVSVSGLKDSGAPFMGTQAQRNMVVKAMRSAIDGNTQCREEQFFFNLICAPGYPELITNMVALNNDRKNTAFIIGDTPMHLLANSISVANWANNTFGDGLSTSDPYLGVFYPAGLTNDVDGNTIAVPASHMMLRTFIRSDNVSYPWFAPAGTRRGLIDNATDIGYVNPVTGGFVRNGITQGMRDALYENRVNPLTILPGVGLVAWGQKTRNPTASAMDRINVARLVNYIRTILARVGDGFLFEPNDKITRDQIKSIIEGAMNDLVAKRGIYDYLVVCDASNNTPDRIARNELYVDIAIEPMKAVEYIYIPIRLKNPGDIAKLG